MWKCCCRQQRVWILFSYITKRMLPGGGELGGHVQFCRGDRAGQQPCAEYTIGGVSNEFAGSRRVCRLIGQKRSQPADGDTTDEHVGNKEHTRHLWREGYFEIHTASARHQVGRRWQQRFLCTGRRRRSEPHPPG